MKVQWLYQAKMSHLALLELCALRKLSLWHNHSLKVRSFLWEKGSLGLEADLPHLFSWLEKDIFPWLHKHPVTFTHNLPENVFTNHYLIHSNQAAQTLVPEVILFSQPDKMPVVSFRYIFLTVTNNAECFTGPEEMLKSWPHPLSIFWQQFTLLQNLPYWNHLWNGNSCRFVHRRWLFV